MVNVHRRIFGFLVFCTWGFASVCTSSPADPGDTHANEDSLTTDTDSDSGYTVVPDILDEYIANGFVSVEPGTFVLGSPETEPCRGMYNEKQVEVTLTYGFEIAATELTQEVWTAAGFPNPSYPKQGVTLPVNYINWNDAVSFCNRLSEYAGLETCYELTGCTGEPGTGCPEDTDDIERGCRDFTCEATRKYEQMNECKGYRMPTHAEWEYAARAGTTGTTYNGTFTEGRIGEECKEIAVLNPIAWYCFNSEGEVHPVGEKMPNSWGLYDVLGNVREWTDSAFTGGGLEEDEGKTGPLTNPMGADLSQGYGQRNTRSRSYRDGCMVRSAAMMPTTFDARGSVLGLRPVRTLPAQ